MGDATAGDDDSDGGVDGSQSGAAAGQGQQSSNDQDGDVSQEGEGVTGSADGTNIGLGGAYTDATDEVGGPDDPPTFGTPDSMLGVAPGRDSVDTNPYTDDIDPPPPKDDGIQALPPTYAPPLEDTPVPIPVTPLLDVQPGPIPVDPPIYAPPPFYQNVLQPGFGPPLAPMSPGPGMPMNVGLVAILAAAAWGVVLGIGYIAYDIANNPAHGGWYGNDPGNFGLPGTPSPHASNDDYLEGNAA